MAELFNQATSQNKSHKTLESRTPVVREQNGLYTALPVVIQSNLAVSGSASLAVINSANQFGANQLVGNNVNWAAGGAPVAPTSGNNTTMVAGTAYWVQLYLEQSQTLTGLEFLTGTTAGTDQWIGALYNNAGNAVAVTALQTVTSLVNSLEKFPFTSTYAASGPGWYFVTLQSTGTTNKFQSYTVPGAAYGAGAIAGTTSTQAAIAIATLVGYTNNDGPISCVY